MPGRVGARHRHKETCPVVNVANWSDANPNRLEPHEPEPTDVVVTLESKH
jgi:hypothetical protein